MTKCNICNGKKEIEVLVMGTDTDWVECPYCKPDEKVEERKEKIKIIKKKMKLKHLNKEYITAKDFSLAFGISEKFAKWYLDNIATVFSTMSRYYKFEKDDVTYVVKSKPYDVTEYTILYK